MISDTIKLSRFIDLTAEITGQPFSYNAQELGAISITMRVPGGLTRENLPQLLDHVLSSRGFTTIRTPGSPVLSVVKLEQAAGLTATLDSSATSTISAGYVTELLEAKHLAAKTLAEAIKPFVSKQGSSVTVLGDSRMLAVSDLSSRLAEVKSLIAKLDVPDAVKTIQVDLEFLPAAQAITVVQELVKKRESAGAAKLQGDLVAAPSGASLLVICRPEAEPLWRELISTVDKREPVETRTYSPRLVAAAELKPLIESIGTAPTAASGVVDERFKAVADDLTRTLTITATKSQHERIAEVLSGIDSAEQTPTPVRTFLIRNRPVSEVLSTVQQLISSGVITGTTREAERAAVSGGASQSSYRTPFPPPTATPPPNPTLPGVEINQAPAASGRGTMVSGTGVSLTSDESTNTLIAAGEPKVLDQIEALLKTIDVRQPQVMLEVLLVSLSDTEALSLGIELERLGSLNNASTQLSSIFGLTGGSAGARTVPDQAGFTGAVLNAGEFSIVVRALESINKGNSLSNPKLLVTNNERAVFSSTLQQPITQQTRTGSNDTTFSYGGSESAGTTISVQPQISQGDHLALTYSIKLSSFVGTSTTAGLPPPKQENSVDSSATIPDGHTVVVGGMELITESEAIAQVPILGSIPIIGELFKTRDRGSGRTRFYVFIRANVLRSGMLEDLKYISATDIAKVQGLGGRIDDGFPEVKARVIR